MCILTSLFQVIGAEPKCRHNMVLPYPVVSGRPQRCQTPPPPPLQEGVALAHMLRPPFFGMLAAQEAGDRMQTGP
jgi:hypothetical protein